MIMHMSIAENHGGLYQNLKLLRETNGQAECNLFKAFGLDYIYVDKGNDTAALIDAFKAGEGQQKAYCGAYQYTEREGLCACGAKTRSVGISVAPFCH